MLGGPCKGILPHPTTGGSPGTGFRKAGIDNRDKGGVARDEVKMRKIEFEALKN